MRSTEKVLSAQGHLRQVRRPGRGGGLGLRGPALLLQHRGQVRHPGPDRSQEGRRAGHCHHLPPPRPHPDGDHPPRAGPLPDLEQLRRGERGRLHRLRQPPRQHRRRGGEAGGPPAPEGLPQGDGGGYRPLRHGRGPGGRLPLRREIVLAASTYNAGIMPFMEDFLHHLKATNYQKRTVGLMENGSWAPFAVKGMTDILSTMKEITHPPRDRDPPGSHEGERFARDGGPRFRSRLNEGFPSFK